MTRIARTVVSLRIIGDDLDPDEITQLLGCAPDSSHCKGDVLRSGARRSFGAWRLEAPPSEPENFDGQIAELLKRATGEIARWSEVSHRFRIDLFCGGFMEESNEGFSLSVKTLRSLADRGIEFVLELYAPDEKE